MSDIDRACFNARHTVEEIKYSVDGSCFKERGKLKSEDSFDRDFFRNYALRNVMKAREAHINHKLIRLC